MLNFLKGWFSKKDKEKDNLLTITINGENYSTENKEEISEFLKLFAEQIKKD